MEYLIILGKGLLQVFIEILDQVLTLVLAIVVLLKIAQMSGCKVTINTEEKEE